MKILFALRSVACVLAFACGAMAAEPSPTPGERRILRPPIDATPAPTQLTRFNLDFPGGTPAELAAAISKATGKHLNLVVPTEQADTKIMPIKVDGVTVPSLFNAISRASVHRLLVVSRNGAEYRDVAINFTTDGPISDQTVWSFSSSAPTAEETASLAEIRSVPPVCRYFQLASYLDNYSIEDITTAIQTGWKMAKVDPLPQLSFHKETQLLIAVGPEASVNQIPDVLSALRLDRGPAVDRIVKLQAELDAETAKPTGGDNKKVDSLRKEIAEIAARQRAREAIDNGGRRMIRPSTAPN